MNTDRGRETDKRIQRRRSRLRALKFCCGALLVGAVAFSAFLVRAYSSCSLERQREPAPEETLTPETETPEMPGEYDYSQPVPESEAVGESYFDDAVFIGDSRTEGFIINTGLSGATAYAYKGLTVDTVFTEKFVNMNGALVSAMDALRSTSFSKVYIMLGINETGWAYSSLFIEGYGRIIDEIRQIAPSAVIYIEEILPVSDYVSETHSYIKNQRIDEYNSLLRTLALEKQVYVIDTASAVAGPDGSLPADAAVDGIHLKKESCLLWLGCLETHTVSK